jgi:hypothetical protein
MWNALLYYAKPSWYIKMTSIREELVKIIILLNGILICWRKALWKLGLKMLMIGLYQEQDIGELHLIYGNVNVVI